MSGADASKFELNDPDNARHSAQLLEDAGLQGQAGLRDAGDSNGDNVYQVTVVASDGVNSAMRDVIVKVTDMEEMA